MIEYQCPNCLRWSEEHQHVNVWYCSFCNHEIIADESRQREGGLFCKYPKDTKTAVKMIDLMNEAYELWCLKHDKYGSKNLARRGEKGILVRVEDKVERLGNIIWNGEDETVDETVINDYFDVAIYMLNAILIHRKEWPGCEEENQVP